MYRHSIKEDRQMGNKHKLISLLIRKTQIDYNRYYYRNTRINKMKNCANTKC